MSYGKWIGGVLGWALGGPIGGILGFAFGTIFDDKSLSAEQTVPGTTGRRRRTTQGDFAAALLVLSAAVMKADGKHLKSELEFIRSFFIRQFGEAVASDQMAMLRELLQQHIPVKEVAAQIGQFMEHSARLQLLHYLFGIARADGEIAQSELRMIEDISRGMSISSSDFESIKAMFYKDPSSAYRVLEIAPDVADEEVKQAYRKMAKKYHPDKLRDLGEEHTKAAEEKFRSVQEAYETIKKQRGLK